MALARVKTWVSGEVLLASDLNSEFNNLLNNSLTLISPLTASLNAGGFKLTNYGSTDVPSASTDVPNLLTYSASGGAARVGFIQSGTGATATTAQSELRRIWYPEQFGADGTETNDTAAWALLLTAVGTSNFEIRGKPGATYLIGAGGISIANKTSGLIVGNGAKLKVNTAATQAPSGLGSTSIFVDTCTNVIFTGWDLDGNSKASNVIGAKSCTDCEISFNKISSGGLTGQIFALNNTRNRYLFNKLDSAIGTSRGMWLGNYAASSMEADFLVKGNQVIGCPATGIVCASVGGRVEGNHSSGHSAGSGIIFGGTGGFSSKYIAIVGNVCRGITGHGIQADVTYSTIADVPVGIVISGNVCELNTSAGIFILYTNGGAISGNVCINNTSGGILIDEASELAVGNNYCCDTRAGGSRTQQVGIQAVAAVGTNNIKNVSFSGNICRNNTFYGLYVQSNSTFTVDSVAITGNVCNDNASRGIFIAEATTGNITGLTVVGNTCRGNTTNDLRVDPLDAVIDNNTYSTEAQTEYWTFTDLATTPSVKGGRITFRANNSLATSITNFTNGVNGQTIAIYAANANTTVNHGTIRLNGNVNFAMAQNNILTLRRIDGVWLEVSRGTAN